MRAAAISAGPCGAHLRRTGERHHHRHRRPARRRQPGPHRRGGRQREPPARARQGDSSVISPDGKLVAVLDYPVGLPGLDDLQGVPVGRRPAARHDACGLHRVTWAPDSRTLVTTDATATRLLTIDAATGTQTTVATASSAASSHRTPSAWPMRPRPRAQRGRPRQRARRTPSAGMPLTRLGPPSIAFGTTHKRGGQTIWNVATIRPDGTHFRQLTHIHPTNFYFGLTPAAGRRTAGTSRPPPSAPTAIGSPPMSSTPSTAALASCSAA